MSDAQQPFDFDHWSQLAAKDPEAFEADRQKMIEQAINEAPGHHRNRLRGLQWKLDQVRRLAHTPMAAAIEMNELMWKQLIGDGGLLDALTHGLIEGSGDVAPKTGGQVLRFDLNRGTRPAQVC